MHITDIWLMLAFMGLGLAIGAFAGASIATAIWYRRLYGKMDEWYRNMRKRIPGLPTEPDDCLSAVLRHLDGRKRRPDTWG